MKATEFVTETPLPDEWDTQVFKPGNAIKKQVDYVLANSPKLGAGSSRVVTSIMYQGRPTALKIAKNKKGLAQNEAELAVANDGYARQLGIVIPIVDWDKENDPPRWLQFEVASKANEKQLCSMMKCSSLSGLVLMAKILLGKRRDTTGMNSARIKENNQAAGFTTVEDEDIFYGYANDLAMLADSYDIELGDLDRSANWGIYKGKPVIIDLGFTSGVLSSYYS